MTEKLKCAYLHVLTELAITARSADEIGCYNLSCQIINALQKCFRLWETTADKNYGVRVLEWIPERKIESIKVLREASKYTYNQPDPEHLVVMALKIAKETVETPVPNIIFVGLAADKAEYVVNILIQNGIKAEVVEP